VGRTALRIELNVAAIDAIVPSSAFVHPFIVWNDSPSIQIADSDYARMLLGLLFPCYYRLTYRRFGENDSLCLDDDRAMTHNIVFNGDDDFVNALHYTIGLCFFSRQFLSSSRFLSSASRFLSSASRFLSSVYSFSDRTN
jgi:hypothetical protein